MPLVSTFGNLSARAFGLGAYRSSVFSPTSLFAAGEQGVWYDPSDLTTMFEDAAGTTAVHTPGNGVADSPVGLLLDKHSGLMASTKHGEGEGVSGQYFSTPYKSITTANIDIKVRYAPAAFTQMTFYAQDLGLSTNRNFIFYIKTTKIMELLWWDSGGTLRTATASVAATLSAGTTYWVRVTLLANNGSGGHDVKFYVNANTGNNTEPSSWTQLGTTVNAGAFTTSIRSNSMASYVGTNSDGTTNNINGKIYFAQAASTIDGSAVQTFTPTDYTSGTTFTSTSSDVWTINGTARIVPDGNHGVQRTSTSRPTLSARYNLLTYSEQFDNAYWNKFQCTVTANSTTAPDGTTTADLVKCTTTSGHYIASTNTGLATAAGTYKQVISFKKQSANWVYFYLSDAGANYAITWADLTNGVLGTTKANGTGFSSVSATISSQSNGFYQVSLTYTKTSSASVNFAFASSSADNVFTQVNGAEYYVWGADIRPSNDGVGLPVYQRIADANTYDSVGFPYYIKSDGVDDFLAASAINFSGTNKMSAFAGVRKTSANTISCVLELTADFAANNGGFGIFAPNSSNQYETESRGTAYQLTGTTSSSYASPVSNVVAGLGDISAPSITLRINGSQISTNTSSQGTGNYANAAMYFFRRNGANYAFGGRAYGIIIRGASSTSTEISNTETWLNGKAKIY